MLAIEQYRREAEALEASRTQKAEQFQKLEQEYYTEYRDLTDKLNKTHSQLNNTLVNWAKSALKGRQKVVLNSLLNNYGTVHGANYVKTMFGMNKGQYDRVRVVKDYMGFHRPVTNDPIVKTMEERMYVLNQQYDVGEFKKPTMEECVGIEIEFFAHDLNRRELNRLARQHKIKGIHLHSDGSLNWDDDYRDDDDDDSSNYMQGYEISFVSPVSKVETELKVLCDWLASIGARVNDTCGLHVHIDMRKRDKDKSRERLISALPYLSRMLPEDRVFNDYCRYGHSRWDSGERYYAINCRSYREHKTIEVRAHSGTTNFEKIINWVKILRNIVDNPEFDGGEIMDSDFYESTSAVRQQVRNANMQEFVNKLKFEGEIANYIFSRNKFW